MQDGYVKLLRELWKNKSEYNESEEKDFESLKFIAKNLKNYVGKMLSSVYEDYADLIPMFNKCGGKKVYGKSFYICELADDMYVLCAV